MKKRAHRAIYGGLASLALSLLGCSTTREVGSEENVLDKIQDANFRSYCAQFDTNSNQKLSSEECRAVTAIDVDNRQIASMRGVEQFTRLRELHCEGNTIGELDLSKNRSLAKLYCGGNYLSELDLTANTKLETLVCGKQSTTLNLILNTQQQAAWVESWGEANSGVILGGNMAPVVVPCTARRGFFIYLAMDNSLSSFADVNISELAEASHADLRGGVILALRDVPNTNSQLLAIFWDEANKVTRRMVLKTYDTNLDTSSPAVFTRVWGDVQAQLKADSWVISLGSHANGWFPASLSTRRTRFGGGNDPGEALLRSLLQDNHGSVMNIDQLAEVLPAVDMLILDACDMGGIESIFALHKKAKYIVASPAEVVNKGMPYDRIIGDIFNPDTRAGAIAICDAFHDLYVDYYDKDLQFGTIALYDSSQMAGFAAAMRKILGVRQHEVPIMSTKDIQSFDRATGGNNLIFDMRETVYSLTADAIDGAAMRRNFDTALAALVPYSKTTGKELVIRYTNGDVHSRKLIPAGRFCGLGCYIPLATYNAANPYYYQTAWAKEVF